MARKQQPAAGATARILARDYDRAVNPQVPQKLQLPRERLLTLDHWEPPREAESDREAAARRQVRAFIHEYAHSLSDIQLSSLATVVGSSLLEGHVLGELIDAGELPDNLSESILLVAHATDYLRSLGGRSSSDLERDLEDIRWALESLTALREAWADTPLAGLFPSLEADPVPALGKVKSWFAEQVQNARHAETILANAGYAWRDGRLVEQGRRGQHGKGGPLLRPLVEALLKEWEKKNRKLLSVTAAKESGCFGWIADALAPLGLPADQLNASKGSALFGAVDNTIRNPRVTHAS